MAGRGAAARAVSRAGWLDQVLDDFERSMLRRGLAPGTVRIYRWAVADLFAFVRRRGIETIGDIHRDELERWQDSLRDPQRPRRLTPSTRNMAHNAVRQMLRFAADRELVDWRLERALVKVKVHQDDPRPIPKDDFAAIRAFLFPRRPHMRLIDLRDRALFAYVLTTTGRISEVLQARRDDFVAVYVTQKGGSKKTLTIPETVREFVEEYVRGRVDDSPWLWIGFRTNTPLDRMNPPGVLKIWKKLAQRVGIKPFTTHQLRHTGATALLGKVSEVAIADKLGHHGIATVHRYAQVSEEEREAVMSIMDDLVQPPDGRRPQFRVLPKIAPGPRRPLR